MAQTDYGVRLGKNDLSKVIANVKTNFKDTGKVADRLDEIQNKFKRIAESTIPTKICSRYVRRKEGMQRRIPSTRQTHVVKQKNLMNKPRLVCLFHEDLQLFFSFYQVLPSFLR